jgi:hypothetical protein
MGWEKRDNKTYYYRKERHGARVVSEYVGSDETAHLVDSLTRLMRERKNRQRAHERDTIARMERQECADGELFDAVEALMQATLLVEGFHRHKGTWRKKRRETTGTAKEVAE